MTALIILWALITAGWAACMIAASRLWTEEGRTTEARYAIAGALIAWAWPALPITALTIYLTYRKRLP
ncbi:hypothetical protein IGS67_11920 [Flavimobilis sp. GY10621]|uniref:Phospholipase_D-nuclease N-terminal n=1 Tax=Flavimobilis rhizosphaerae TaxID=2775421 RepID=A0ABR9DSX0_9MICO|nr:hypothetical protein [Flavimobilis rhizosphaerae]MBD9700186.1 hypothetical protein [Flavimobilis rhizosphaerae]